MTTPPVPDAAAPATEPAEPRAEAGPEPAGKPGARRGVPGVLKVAGLVVAIVAALLAATYFARDTPAAAKAGDCAHNAGNDAEPDVSLVDCHSADAEFTVLKVVHGANEQDCQTEPALVATYVETRRSSTLVLCLGVHG
ncbi:hypothetical protein [Kitasatospora phosalacinea]|uniref:Uncharacterized protein n=1 Tax=Kitasatospora phosalacinea TaxID=2065 RepID=A0ABW6GFR6_9ACTN